MKQYKPKEKNVQKVKELFTKVKTTEPKQSYLFSKVVKIAIISIFLSSCSAEWHLNQACKKEPLICENEVVVWDTIVIRDTFQIQREYYTKQIDTIVIDSGKVMVKIIREYDKIKTFVKLKPDTIKVTMTKQLPPRVIYKDKQTNFNWFVILLAIISIVLWLNQRR